MKKIILSGLILSGLLAKPALTTDDIIKNAYTTGIYDTLSVLAKDINNLNKTKEIKGYIVYINISNMPMIDIIKYEAFGLKIGLNPVLTKNRLIFVVKERKADAKLIKKMIMKKSSLKPEIIYFDKKVYLRNVIEEYLNQKIPQKVLLVYVKEKIKNNTCEKVEIKGKLHLINRILNQKAFNLKCKNGCKPKTNATVNEEKKTIKNIKATIGKKHFDLSNKNFYQLSNIIVNYGTITKDNKLILGDKIYSVGDKLNNKYTITLIDFNKGIITIDKMFFIKTKRIK